MRGGGEGWNSKRQANLSQIEQRRGEGVTCCATGDNKPNRVKTGGKTKTIPLWPKIAGLTVVRVQESRTFYRETGPIYCKL